MTDEKSNSPEIHLTNKAPETDIPRPKPKHRNYVLSPQARAKLEQARAEKKLERLQKKKQSILRKAKKAKEEVEAPQKFLKAAAGNTNSGHIVTDKVLEKVHEDIYGDAEVIFQPNPGPQTDFFSSNEQELAFGGAAGGGKSMALIVDAARDAWCPEHRAIIFRKTLDELRNLISKTKSIYPQLYPKARWLEQKMTWSFPSGAEVWYTYLDRDDDVERYQGQDFNYVGFDEGGHWATPYCWNYMRSRLRTTTKGLGLYQRVTANPGGAGGWWLKKMFIDPAPPNTPFWATDIETGKVLTWPDDERLPDGSPHPRAGLPLFRRKFIPSRLKDNPYLFKDGRYQQNLLALPEIQRRRLLDGDWDVVEGAAFPEFYRGVHVVEPFRIPESWIRFRSCDYGYARHAAVLWFACDPDGRLYVYRELYVRGATVNKLAELINEVEQKDRVRYGVLDSSMWSSRGDTGPAPAEVMNSYLRPPFRQSDRSPGSRVAGKLELHRRFVLPEPTFMMAADGTKITIPGRPLLQFFSTCTNLIRTIPALQLDKNNPEDVDTDGEDDLYDALRYGIMTRPMKPQFNFMMKPSSRVITTSPVAADRVFGY